MMTRRSWLRRSAVLGSTAFLPVKLKPKLIEDDLEVHIFSKHLQFLDYAEMAKLAAQIGFDGVELTVRPKGHVLPENVSVDLPTAVEAIRGEGLKASMVASDVNDVSALHSQEVLQTLSAQGIEKYRMRYYRYPKSGDLLSDVLSFRESAEALHDLNRELGLCAVYQNHAGTMFGSSMWEIRQLCEGFSSDLIGCQYDIRHATVEGGNSWSKEIRLVLPYIKSIVAKDFLWQEVEGKWKVTNVPLGEGMVDFGRYFRILKDHGIQVPVVLHLEYPIAGAEHGDRDLSASGRKVVETAMERDLATIRKMWKEA